MSFFYDFPRAIVPSPFPWRGFLTTVVTLATALASVPVLTDVIASQPLDPPVAMAKLFGVAVLFSVAICFVSLVLGKSTTTTREFGLLNSSVWISSTLLSAAVFPYRWQSTAAVVRDLLFVLVLCGASFMLGALRRR